MKDEKKVDVNITNMYLSAIAYKIEKDIQRNESEEWSSEKDKKEASQSSQS